YPDQSNRLAAARCSLSGGAAATGRAVSSLSLAKPPSLPGQSGPSTTSARPRSYAVEPDFAGFPIGSVYPSFSPLPETAVDGLPAIASGPGPSPSIHAVRPAPGRIAPEPAFPTNSFQ